MALLNRLLRLLEFIEGGATDLADFAAWLRGTPGLVLMVGLGGYASLLGNGCTAPTAALLTSVVGLALHCVLSEPEA